MGTKQKRVTMGTISSKEKVAELLELIEIPEIRQIVLAKFDQTKLLFKEEVREFRREKLKNIVPFPIGGEVRDNNKMENSYNDRETGEILEKKIRDGGFFDTTLMTGLSEMEQIEVFLKFFYGKSKFRREVLFEFLLKKMPFLDSYEDAV